MGTALAENSKAWSRIALASAIAGGVFIWGRFPPDPLFVVGAVLLAHGVFAAIRGRRFGAPLFGVTAMSYLALALIAGLAFLHTMSLAIGTAYGPRMSFLPAIFGDPAPPPPTLFDFLIGLLYRLFALLTCAFLVAAGLAPSTALGIPRSR